MTSEVKVSVQGVSKAYYLYPSSADRLKQSLLQRLGRSRSVPFWALRNVSFEVGKGQVLGVIGKNGSGKSTLLQIIAGTLQPTEGTVQTNGRLAALLELGAGFNPDFSGKENIFLSGALFGLSQKEITARYDQITAFADIGGFIDQPVKFYSTGMYVRLAFAISTMVDPQILLVDEALAVGDASFVIKCMKHMDQLRKRGTTILLVTHDLQTVRSFCDTVIWLSHGNLQMAGSSIDVTSRYMEEILSESATQTLLQPVETQASETSNAIATARWGSGEIRIVEVRLNGSRLSQGLVFEYGCPLQVDMTAQATKDIATGNVSFGFSFRNLKGLDVIVATTYDDGRRFPLIKAGEKFELKFKLVNILAPADYSLSAAIDDRSQTTPHYYDVVENPIVFKVISDKPIFSLVLPTVEQEVRQC